MENFNKVGEEKNKTSLKMSSTETEWNFSL